MFRPRTCHIKEPSSACDARVLALTLVLEVGSCRLSDAEKLVIGIQEAARLGVIEQNDYAFKFQSLDAVMSVKIL